MQEWENFHCILLITYIIFLEKYSCLPKKSQESYEHKYSKGKREIKQIIIDWYLKDVKQWKCVQEKLYWRKSYYSESTT